MDAVAVKVAHAVGATTLRKAPIRGVGIAIHAAAVQDAGSKAHSIPVVHSGAVSVVGIGLCVNARIVLGRIGHSLRAVSLAQAPHLSLNRACRTVVGIAPVWKSAVGPVSVRAGDRNALVGLWIKRLVLRTVSTLKAAVLGWESAVLTVIEPGLPKAIVLAIEAVTIAVSCSVHYAGAVLGNLSLRAADVIASASGKKQDA